MRGQTFHLIEKQIEHDELAGLSIPIDATARLDEAGDGKALAKARAERDVDASLDTARRDERPVRMFHVLEPLPDTRENLGTVARAQRGRQMQDLVTALTHRVGEHASALDGVQDHQPRPRLSRDAGDELTESERIDYQKCAERSGLSLTQWIRDKLAQAARREGKDA